MLQIGNQNIVSPLDPKLQNLGDVLNRVTNFLIPIAAVILLFVFIWGGYDVLMSQGSAEKVKAGRLKITAGIVGLILMVFAYVITRLVARVFGLGEGLF